MTKEEFEAEIKRMLSRIPDVSKIDTHQKATLFKQIAKKASVAKTQKAIEQSYNDLKVFYK